MISFAYTILYVKDVVQTISFYEQAFGFKRKFIDPTNQYGELSTGATTLSFAILELAAKNVKGGVIESSTSARPFAIEIAFATNDVEGVYNHAIKHGAMPEAAPEQKPHGQTVAYVRDINGFLVEICTPME